MAKEKNHVFLIPCKVLSDNPFPWYCQDEQFPKGHIIQAPQQITSLHYSKTLTQISRITKINPQQLCETTCKQILILMI